MCISNFECFVATYHAEIRETLNSLSNNRCCSVKMKIHRKQPIFFWMKGNRNSIQRNQKYLLRKLLKENNPTQCICFLAQLRFNVYPLLCDFKIVYFPENENIFSRKKFLTKHTYICTAFYYSVTNDRIETFKLY